MKLLKIYWKDIAPLSDGWKGLKHCIEEADKLYEHEMISVGYLIHDTPDYVVIAASVDDTEPEDPNYNDVSMIMKSVITNTIEI
jgi:hypothetical protein